MSVSPSTISPSILITQLVLLQPKVAIKGTNVLPRQRYIKRAPSVPLAPFLPSSLSFLPLGLSFLFCKTEVLAYLHRIMVGIK